MFSSGVATTFCDSVRSNSRACVRDAIDVPKMVLCNRKYKIGGMEIVVQTIIGSILRGLASLRMHRLFGQSALRPMVKMHPTRFCAIWLLAIRMQIKCKHCANVYRCMCYAILLHVMCIRFACNVHTLCNHSSIRISG